MRCDVGSLGSSDCGSLVWIEVANMNVAREGEWKHYKFGYFFYLKLIHVPMSTLISSTT